MDSLFLSAYGGDDDDSLFTTTSLGSIQSLSDLDDERLYLVDHRWWNETRESMFVEVDGSSYATSSCYSDDSESEIVLNMRRIESSENCGVDCCEDERGVCDVSGREYALISEWMFYRTLKWHYDMKNAENIVAVEDNNTDFFVLQVSLSISQTMNSLVVKINPKDNSVGAFNRSREIFSVNLGLFKIWDFSGQITKFFLQGSMLPPDDDDIMNEEIFLELQVYGLSYDKTLKENDVSFEDKDMEPEVKVNGHSDKVEPYVKHGQPQLANSFRLPYELGLTGLHNLGNTCFMNSAIQCLVHTPQLVDYFLGDFRKDLNFGNPLGMNGRLALEFGVLLRQLWTPGTTSVAPREFKSRIADFAPQFGGYNQHDSQEFLAFLLDGLHEDLNRVKIKPYNEIKDIDGISDKDVADEHWKNHLARNNSIIVDLCQGQYRSTLTCPLCKKHSVKFDPFLYLSLPLPSKTTRSMTLTVLTTDGSTLPTPVTVTVPKFGQSKDLIQALSTACSLREDETLLVAEIYNNRIFRYLDKPSDCLDLVRDNDQLVAYRLRKDQDSLPLVVFTHSHYEVPGSKFGIPLVARIPECSNGFELHKIFLQLLEPFVMREEFCSDSLDDNSVNIGNPDVEIDGVAVDDVVNYMALDDVVDGVAVDGVAVDKVAVDEVAVDKVAVDEAAVDKVAVDDGFDDVAIEDVSNKGKSTIDENFHFSMDEAGLYLAKSKIEMDEPLLIPESRKLSIRVSWPNKKTKQYDTSILDRLPEAGVHLLRRKNPPELVSLSKCLEAFLKEDPLGPEDMWYCPTCKEHQQASKKLDLWRLPEILIIHLKRFSYNRLHKDKLETFVDFPIVDFDLSNYTVHKDSRSPGRYKLYAVSNHYGGLGGGHYTAFAQCGGQWYEFNDSQVLPVDEEQIKTAAAYVLFYKRS